jgi:hypothetical protein
MGWMYGFLTLRAFSHALGVVEVAIAILIGLRHWSARASALGSGGAVLMFLNNTLLLAFDARVGAKPRWVSLALCSTRTVPVEGRWYCSGRQYGHLVKLGPAASGFTENEVLAMNRSGKSRPRDF